MAHHPAKILPFVTKRSIALTPKILKESEYTLFVPFQDTLDSLCLVPDRDDGAVTYGRLCEAIYEYYDDATQATKRLHTLGKYTYFGGIAVHAAPLTKKTFITLNLFT